MPFDRLHPGLVFFAAVLLVGACTSTNPAATSSAPPGVNTPVATSTNAPATPAGGSASIDASSLEACLKAAGLDVVTGSDTPKISGVSAIGVSPAGGKGDILPGNHAAAVFEFETEEAATGSRAMLLLQRPPLPLEQVVRQGTVVVLFAPAPLADFRDQVLACAPTGS